MLQHSTYSLFTQKLVTFFVKAKGLHFWLCYFFCRSQLFVGFLVVLCYCFLMRLYSVSYLVVLFGLRR